MIGVIDYGAGNLRSVCLAIQRCGFDCAIVSKPDQLNAVSALVLPGVGSFSKAAFSLQSRHMDLAIKEQLLFGKKLLGICLGMQLLFDYGCEDGLSKGLGLIPGTISPIPTLPGLRIPHIGWNSVRWESDHPVISGIDSDLDFYHVHSFHCLPYDSTHILASTVYGIELVTAVSDGQVIGFQFHPEKSQPAGTKLLLNFLNWAI